MGGEAGQERDLILGRAGRNARRFVWFRTLFNCRFYYVVYTILFLDLGLDLRQFALLHVLWAATIILLEVPSGALADWLGRKTLVVVSAWLMVVEMLLLLAVPVGQPVWTFWILAFNRIVSGAAEAAASGADEALAYDSWPEGERADRWPGILVSLTRLMAAGFVLSAIIGGLVYDARIMTSVWRFLGGPGEVAADLSLKFPIFLNLIAAVCCVVVACRMEEPGGGRGHRASGRPEGIRGAFREVGATARWIWRSPAVLVLIVLGLFFDHLVRMFYTISSNFYRLIEIPEWAFGAIGAGAALAGIFTGGLMGWMVKRWGASTNFLVVTLLIFAGLLGLAWPVAKWGLLGVVPLLLVMRFLQFFLSHYLNAVTDSTRRATVLSFKGLSMNLGYAAINLLFLVQTGYLAGRYREGELEASGRVQELAQRHARGGGSAGGDEAAFLEETTVFAASLSWAPIYFSLGLGLILLWVWARYRRGLDGLILSGMKAVGGDEAIRDRSRGSLGSDLSP